MFYSNHPTVVTLSLTSSPLFYPQQLADVGRRLVAAFVSYTLLNQRRSLTVISIVVFVKFSTVIQNGFRKSPLSYKQR